MKSIQDIKLRHIAAFAILPLVAGYISAWSVWQTSDGSIATSLQTGWGDLLFHIRAAIFFFQQGGIPHESFFLSGQPVGYAYAADFLSTLLLYIHIPLALSFLIPTVILVILSFTLLELLVFRLTKSYGTALLAALLFIGFGGLQAFTVLPELSSSSQPFLEALRDLPHSITPWHDQNMIIINPFVMMLHQRSYLLGLPIFLLLLLISYKAFQKKNPKTLVLIALIGILLAFVHPHTWAASLLILPAWGVSLWLLKVRSFSRQEIIEYAVPYLAMTVGGYVMIKILQPEAGASLIHWHPGWLEPSVKWPLFWIRNIGLHAILAPIAFFVLRKKNKELAALLLASVVPFVAANLFQFAPWDWDNTKMLVPTWAITSITNAALLVHIVKKGIIHAIMVVLLVCMLIFSGGLEAVRVLSYYKHPLVIGTAEAMQIGERLNANTKPTDVILSAPEASHPAFVFSGRPSFLVYEGWLWSQGWKGHYEQRELDYHLIYNGGTQAKTLLEQYGIGGVVIGPLEKRGNVNTSWFEDNFAAVNLSKTTRLYLIR